MFIRRFTFLALLVLSPALAAAQNTQAPTPGEPTFTDTVVVVGATPLSGVGVPIDQVPSPVQTATAKDLERSGSLDVSDFLNRRFTGVHVNETQGNPLQVDLNYRGYTASPLLGTPQGLSVYLDGMRLNQPFGETVSWDLIPRIAIATTTLMPGSNPVFGLNTLGGALALESKSGRTMRGTTVVASYGSDFRRTVDVEHGGRSASGTFDWYGAGSFFGDDGWRDDSPSDVRQLFARIGWVKGVTDVTVVGSHANNSLHGNGLQEFRLLDRDYAGVYTKPDVTDNRSTLLNASVRRRLDARHTLLANGYFRDINTRTLNGDINEESLDQSLYQPGAAERAALAAAGYGAIPASGLNADTTPFPSLRCIGNVLLGDEPGEKCNGLINRARSVQRNGGGSLQWLRREATTRGEHLLIAGAAIDHSRIRFAQTTELGYLTPDRGIAGLGVFADGASAGEIDGEPFDTRVDLNGAVTVWSLYATDTLPLRERVHLTLSGRYNQTRTHNRDQINPGGGPSSLDGDHVVGRFNPAAGITIGLPRAHNVYAGYSEGSRAATAIELGCANPDKPCRLPNSMAGDPPLAQVITRTFETGVRGAVGHLSWNASAFHADNDHDILFVTSEQTGFGYFRNFGQTRRQGLEIGAQWRAGRALVGGGYTFLLATFENAETVNGEGNSTNDSAASGRRGLEGAIEIEAGNHLPLVPEHLLKLFTDVDLTSRLALDVDLVATGGSFARGNENNAHEPDGTYYLGDGRVDGYAVVNLGARATVTPWLQITAQVNNLFDRRYATAAQLGASGFTAAGVFESRALPAAGGEFPVRQSTFVAPGAPRRAWIGTKISF